MPSDLPAGVSLVDRLKMHLSDPRDRIALDDLVVEELRLCLKELSAERFPIDARPVDGKSIAARLSDYETVVGPLLSIVALLAWWATEEQRPSLERLISRLFDSVEELGGSIAWISLQWYPLSLVQYVGGIAAVAAGNYENLSAILLTPTNKSKNADGLRLAVHAVAGGIGEADTYNVFKALPAYERFYLPRSEHMFKTVRPVLEQNLFLGSSYEECFDRFELIVALAYADRGQLDLESVWGPPGRFALKYGSGINGDAVTRLIAEATTSGDAWPPLAAGFFRGSSERFLKVANLYVKGVLPHVRSH